MWCLLFFFWLTSVWQTLVSSTSLWLTQFCSFLWPSNIPLFMLYHLFCIHSSVDGHLGCFHALAIVNSAVMNIRIRVPFWVMLFCGYMPSSGNARSYGCSIYLFFYETFILFSTVAVPIRIPTNSVGGFLVSTQSPACVVCRIFDDDHSGWCELIEVLVSVFLIISNVDQFFMRLLAIFISLWKNIYLGLLPILIGLFEFFGIELHELFVYFGD